MARSDDVGVGPVRVELLGEQWAIARLAGRLVAFADRCPHRSTRLSVGWVEGDARACTGAQPESHSNASHEYGRAGLIVASRS